MRGTQIQTISNISLVSIPIHVRNINTQQVEEDANHDMATREQCSALHNTTPCLVYISPNAFNYRFPALPICVPCTLLPKSNELLLSCQCAASGDRCSSMSVRLLLPSAAVPPREDWRRYVNCNRKLAKKRLPRTSCHDRDLLYSPYCFDTAHGPRRHLYPCHYCPVLRLHRPDCSDYG